MQTLFIVHLGNSYHAASQYKLRYSRQSYDAKVAQHQYLLKLSPLLFYLVQSITLTIMQTLFIVHLGASTVWWLAQKKW
jgi:hypothetical protein